MKPITAASTPPDRIWLAWLAAWAAVAIGAGWQLATRHGARSSLAPLDLALLRYTVPALLLAPVWWRHGLLPGPDLSVVRFTLIVAGAGLPFGLLAMVGASYAPATHMGALIPGLSPLLTLLRASLLGLGAMTRLTTTTTVTTMTTLTSTRAVGAGVTLCGVLLVVFPVLMVSTVNTQSLILGDRLFVAAAVMWTAYTLAFRGSRLQPLQAVSVISAYSALMVVPLWLMAYVKGDTRLLQAPAHEVALQFLMQGVLAGVVGLYVIGFAIRGIGATRTAAAGALVPVVVALGAWFFLGEAMTAYLFLGSVVTSLGVWLMLKASRNQ